MNGTLVILIVIVGVIIFSGIWYTQPKEVKQDISETIKKLPLEITNETIPTKEPKKVINETRVKEIEKSLKDVTKIKSGYDKIYIEKAIVQKDYTPVIIEVNDSNKIYEIISIFLEGEFELKEISISPPSTFSGNITKIGLQKLEGNPYVVQIYYGGFIVKPTLKDSVSLINANNAWSLKKGSINITGNTTICIIDTGVNYTHPDLGGCFGVGCKIIGGYNTINENNNITDTDGHGTHVAGIVAANGSIKGVAPDIKIVALKAIGGTFGDVKEAVNWCISNKNQYNISIVSMSFGINDENNNEIIYNSTCDAADIIVKATNNATTFGLFVDVSAGNSGNKTGLTSCMWL